MSELDEIIEMSGLDIVKCACSECVGMCKKTPCLGTPEDILRLVNNGYVDQLEVTTVTAMRKHGMPDVITVAPKYDVERGCCTFLENDLCTLHDKGLKPTEGKLANCKVDVLEPGKIPPAVLVCASWMAFHNLKTMALVFEAIIKHDDKLKKVEDRGYKILVG